MLPVKSARRAGTFCHLSARSASLNFLRRLNTLRRVAASSAPNLRVLHDTLSMLSQQNVVQLQTRVKRDQSCGPIRWNLRAKRAKPILLGAPEGRKKRSTLKRCRGKVLLDVFSLVSSTSKQPHCSLIGCHTKSVLVITGRDARQRECCLMLVTPVVLKPWERFVQDREVGNNAFQLWQPLIQGLFKGKLHAFSQPLHTAT